MAVHVSAVGADHFSEMALNSAMPRLHDPCESTKSTVEGLCNPSHTPVGIRSDPVKSNYPRRHSSAPSPLSSVFHLSYHHSLATPVGHALSHHSYVRLQAQVSGDHLNDTTALQACTRDGLALLAPLSLLEIHAGMLYHVGNEGAISLQADRPGLTHRSFGWRQWKVP